MSSRMLEQPTAFTKYLWVNLSENGLRIFSSCVKIETPLISTIRTPYASIFVAKDAGLNISRTGQLICRRHSDRASANNACENSPIAV
ncbi:unnamed protein product [Debaryomyces tyrocola]|nr:unnamed protein product [Debaryomyces tyrocola]